MGIDFGRAARGIATGYLTEKIRDTRLADEAKAEDIKFAKRKYMEVDLPNLLKEEKTRAANIKLIDAELGPVFSNYLDNYDIPLSTQLTKQYIDQFKAKNFTDEEKLQIESTISGRKKQRAEDLESEYNAKLDFVKTQESKKPGGSGSKNLMDMFFPGKDKDIADVGIGQAGEQPMATETEEQVTDIKQPIPLRDILGGGDNIYDIKKYGTERREFDTDFRTTFRNPVSGAPEINVGPSDPRYDLQQFLKEGYTDAYKGGEFQYMLNKYIDTQFKNQGITGYPTGFDKTTETGATEVTSQDTKSVPGDNKKFDAPDVSQIGVKEDANINLKSTRVIEGGGSGSPAIVINDLRDIIARISDSPSLSDDEKNKRIDTARSRAKQRLEAMGLDSDNFNL